MKRWPNELAANQKWVGDITYLHTDAGWLYLAVMIDWYSRMVIGWAMSKRMTADLACDALRMALWRSKQPKGVSYTATAATLAMAIDLSLPAERVVRVLDLLGIHTGHEDAKAWPVLASA